MAESVSGGEVCKRGRHSCVHVRRAQAAKVVGHTASRQELLLLDSAARQGGFPPGEDAKEAKWLRQGAAEMWGTSFFGGRRREVWQLSHEGGHSKQEVLGYILWEDIFVRDLV